MDIIKVGPVELTPDHAMELYQKDKYIVSFKTIYQLFYSEAQGRVYGHPIHKKQTAGGYTRAGRWFAYDGREVNHLLGYQLVNE